MQSGSLRGSRGPMMPDGYVLAKQFPPQHQGVHAYQQYQQPTQRSQPSPLMQPQVSLPPGAHQFQPSQQQRRRSNQNPMEFNLRHSLSSPQLSAMTSSSKTLPDLGWDNSSSVTRSSMRSSNGTMSDGILAMSLAQEPAAHTETVTREQRNLTVQPQSYAALQEVGSGGAGKAYLVRGKEDGKTYIAKQIICLGDKYRAAPASYALHETRLMFLLRHPHIVELLDFYPKSSMFCIIMEFCEQGDLGKHIESANRQRSKAFDVDRIYMWWYQMLDAIDYCHAKGIIHRDLKPKNIFLDANFNVKIGDFGVSALIYFPPAAERVGTVTYHAPEVQASLSYSTHSDIWSIGVIMWETMILRPSGGDPITLQHVNLTSIAHLYGSAARNLLIHQLQQDPEQRPPAGFLKESLMKELAAGSRERVAATAAASSIASQKYAERQREWMTPKQIPDSGAAKADVVVGHTETPTGPSLRPSEAPDRAQAARETSYTPQQETPVVPAVRPQKEPADSVALFAHEPPTRAPEPPRRSPEPNREEQMEQPAVAERTVPTDIASKPTIVAADPVQFRSSAPPLPAPASSGRPTDSQLPDSKSGNDPELAPKEANDLGISLSAGQGGEYGAWKIAQLNPSKGAGKSGEIQVGMFLWEINKKVIFGMPLSAIMGLLKGKPGGKVTLGLKAGLGLPIRHVTLNADGSIDEPSQPQLLESPLSAAAPADSTSSAADSAPSDNQADSGEPEPEKDGSARASSPATAPAAPVQDSLGASASSQPDSSLHRPVSTSPATRMPSTTEQNNDVSVVSQGGSPPPAQEASPEPELSPARQNTSSPQLTPESLTPRAQSEEAPAAAHVAREASRSSPVPSPPPQTTVQQVATADEVLPRSASSDDAQPRPWLRSPQLTTQSDRSAISRASPMPLASPSDATASRSTPPMDTPASVVPRFSPETPLSTMPRTSPAVDPLERRTSPVASAADTAPSAVRASPYSSSGDASSTLPSQPAAAAEGQSSTAFRSSSNPRGQEAGTGSLASGAVEQAEASGEQASVARSALAGSDEGWDFPSGSRLTSASSSTSRTKNEIVPVKVSSAVARVVSADSGAGYATRISSATRSQVVGTAQIAGDGQYSGELRDGKPFGKGTATWPQQGHTYAGEWRNGVMHGQGTATYLNGDRYDGEWSNGKRSGLGRYAHGSGDVFEGLWANERKDNLGVDTFADGRGYRGEFKENKFAGVGTYFTVDGAMYQGDWFQGKAHGYGISLSAKGGQPAFVQYSHGNLTQSELMGKNEHYEMKDRVEQRSMEAVQTALQARRVAASIQNTSIDTTSAVMTELEREIGDVALPTNGMSLLGKVVHMLVGIYTVMHDDSTLAVTSFESDAEVERIPVSIGDTIVEVSERSCSWYKSMSLEEILVHLQSTQTFWLQLGVRSRGSPDWTRSRVVQVSKREAGFVV